MGMPSGWCAGQFPEDLLDSAESIYRDEMKKLIPAARDDKTYFTAYTEACAMHALKFDIAYIPEIFEEDKKWGGRSERARILSHFKAVINITEKHDTLPSIKATLTEILARLEKKWEEAKPLDLYPAFTK